MSQLPWSQECADEGRRPSRAGAPRPASGAFLLFAALALLGHPAAARAQSDQDAAWPGDETDAMDAEQPDQAEPPAGEGADAYAQGYEDGKRDALAEQTAGPSMDDFHGSLDQSGEWVQTSAYGAVWRPTSVDESWRPYTQGNWCWTRHGWTWVGDEPWGWAVYHYGRWVVLPGQGQGWAWIPGRVWAPAWVAWRWGGGWAGWAPLGPRGGVAWNDAAWWIFVEQRRFLEPVRHYTAPIGRFGEVVPRARPLRWSHGVIGGPVRRVVAGAVGRPIEPVRIDTVGRPALATSGVHVTGGVIHVFAPQTRPLPPAGGSAADRARGSPRWAPRSGWGNRAGERGGSGPGIGVHATPLTPGGNPVHFGGVPSFHPGGPPPANPGGEGRDGAGRGGGREGGEGRGGGNPRAHDGDSGARQPHASPPPREHAPASVPPKAEPKPKAKED